MKIAFLFAVLVAVVQGFAPVAQPRAVTTELGLFGKKSATATATKSKTVAKKVVKGKAKAVPKKNGKFTQISNPDAKKSMTIFERQCHIN